MMITLTIILTIIFIFSMKDYDIIYGKEAHHDDHMIWLSFSPVRYVLIIQSNVESGPKTIQFNIQFKINSEIFIQSKNSFKS